MCQKLKLVSKIERTEIESKSQPSNSSQAVAKVGIKDRKNWNWKQITTTFKVVMAMVTLVSKIERTEIESKSQHSKWSAYSTGSWYQR